MSEHETDGDEREALADFLLQHVVLEADRRLWNDDERAAWEEHASMSFTLAREAALTVHARTIADAWFSLRSEVTVSRAQVDDANHLVSTRDGFEYDADTTTFLCAVLAVLGIEVTD